MLGENITKKKNNNQQTAFNAMIDPMDNTAHNVGFKLHTILSSNLDIMTNLKPWQVKNTFTRSAE